MARSGGEICARFCAPPEGRNERDPEDSRDSDRRCCRLQPLAGADEDRILARLRALRSDLIHPAIDAHHGRIVKRTGDGSLIEFRSVVDAVRCAIEVQNARFVPDCDLGL